jgi:hypothetical protein
MFIIYPLFLALIVGLLLRGSTAALGRLPLRWGWLAVASLAFQLLLFSTPLGDALGRLAPLAYVASTTTAFLFVMANVRLPGLVVVAAGAGSNLVAIVANGGFMPTTPAALAAAGHHISAAYTNSMTGEHVVLAPLTDIFALPPEVPMANVFSIGDALIGVGIFVLVLTVMLRGRRATHAASSSTLVGPAAAALLAPSGPAPASAPGAFVVPAFAAAIPVATPVFAAPPPASAPAIAPAFAPAAAAIAPAPPVFAAPPPALSPAPPAFAPHPVPAFAPAPSAPAPSAASSGVTDTAPYGAFPPARSAWPEIVLGPPGWASAARIARPRVAEVPGFLEVGVAIGGRRIPVRPPVSIEPCLGA